jgi:hypothetical protein
MQPVGCAGSGESAPQPPRDPGEVAAGQLRLAQAKRLHEQHAALARHARHQVLLVGPQLGVPVGEPHAQDLASAQSFGVWHRRHDPRAPARAGYWWSLGLTTSRSLQGTAFSVSYGPPALSSFS